MYNQTIEKKIKYWNTNTTMCSFLNGWPMANDVSKSQTGGYFPINRLCWGLGALWAAVPMGFGVALALAAVWAAVVWAVVLAVVWAAVWPTVWPTVAFVVDAIFEAILVFGAGDGVLTVLCR